MNKGYYKKELSQDLAGKKITALNNACRATTKFITNDISY